MSNQFSNQKCSKCRSIYVGLRVGDYDSSCEHHEHFFKKNGKLFCVNCLMAEGHIKCGKCCKLISRYEDLGKWRRNVGLWDDHTSDADTFGNGLCWCRKCSAENKTEVKECQGTVFTHHKGGYKAGGSTQFNQCFSAVANEGDVCEHCKGQTETYKQVKARIAGEEKQSFEKYKQAQEKAQNWWNTLSGSEQERECERVVENMKLGKYWANNVKEGEGSGWTCDGSWWWVKNGKLVSSSPHLVPIQIVEEFGIKEFGEVTIQTAINNNSQLVTNLSSSTQPQQSITSKNNHLDSNIIGNQQSNQGQSTENNAKNIKLVNKKDNSKINSPAMSIEQLSNEENKETLIINLRTVKQITLTPDGNLVIEFNKSESGDSSQTTQTITNEQISNNQELQTVKNYLQKSKQKSASQQDLNNILNTSSNTTERPKDNSNTFLIVSVSGALIIGVGIGLFLKRKRNIKKN